MALHFRKIFKIVRSQNVATDISLLMDHVDVLKDITKSTRHVEDVLKIVYTAKRERNVLHVLKDISKLLVYVIYVWKIVKSALIRLIALLVLRDLVICLIAVYLLKIRQS
jgi:hypothetical protein